MKLVSMKNTSGHEHGCSCCEAAPSGCGEPDYPYGTRLNLEEDQVEALGLSALPSVGSTVEVQGIANVIGVSEEKRDGKTFRRLELQMTDLGVGPAKSDVTNRMYPKNEE